MQTYELDRLIESVQQAETDLERTLRTESAPRSPDPRRNPEVRGGFRSLFNRLLLLPPDSGR